MKCLSDEIIQVLIDGELSIEEQEHADMHLKECSHCSERLEEQKELTASFIASMGKLVEELPEVPVLIQAKKKNVLSKNILYRFIYPLAAASILLLFLLLPINKNNEDQTEFFVLCNVGGEIDANLPLSDQEIEITFYDADGNEIY